MCLFELAVVTNNTNLDDETMIFVFKKGEPVYAATFKDCDARVLWEIEIKPFRDAIYFLKDTIVIFLNHIEGIINGGSFYVDL